MKNKLIAAGLLAAAVVITYRDAPRGSFHFDDVPNITEHAPVVINQWSTEALFGALMNPAMSRRGIPSLTFAIDWLRGDGAPATFIWTNIVIHCLVAIAIFVLFLELLPTKPTSPPRRVTIAFITAAAWALHPLQSQAVAYAVQRMTSMATLAAVLSVWAWIRARRYPHRRGLWYGFALAAFGLGTMCKEIVWVTPALWVLAEPSVVRVEGPVIRRGVDWLLLFSPLIVSTLALLSMLLQIGPFENTLDAYAVRDFSLMQRVLTQPRVIAFYLSLLLWPAPSRLSLQHDFTVSTSLVDPWTTFVAHAAVVAWLIIGTHLLLRTRRGPWLLFWMWFPASLVIESSVIPLEMVYEHRMYLPSIALFGLGALLLARVSVRAPSQRAWTAFVAGVVAVILVLSLATTVRTHAWRDEETLWTDVLDEYPNLARAHVNLGKALWDRDQRPQAISHYERAVELDPDLVMALLNLARAYRTIGQGHRVEPLYLRAVGIDPNRADLRFSLALFLIEQGRFVQARQQLQYVLRLDPGHAQARTFLKFAEQKLGDGQIPDGE